mmetsp:Transcript_6564/g.7610  ORF Transcript_6564/g.7610 Transcript_6564/m.7610 type:complete len:435 (-) Transcript_6564:35-1339(-)
MWSLIVRAIPTTIIRSTANVKICPPLNYIIIRRMLSSAQSSSSHHQPKNHPKNHERKQQQYEDQHQYRRHRHPNRHQNDQKESKGESRSAKKWIHPFWCPPGSSTSSSQNTRQHYRDNNRNHNRNRNRFPNVEFRDVSLPCRRHLDPHDSMNLPTSNWVQLFGALPMTSLEEVLESIENILRDELTSADTYCVIDLDAFWNPVKDTHIPIISPSALIEQPRKDKTRKESEQVGDDVNYNNHGNDRNKENDCYSNKEANTDTSMIEPFRVRSAHVVLSPFGRPTGWNLELANASLVHALLSAAKESRISGSIRIGWKFAQVKVYHPPLSPVLEDSNDSRTMFTVDDTMVRFENCPQMLNQDYLRHIVSRYELAMRGETIVKWKGMTSTGDSPPLTYVVRFANAAWARAAVREMQAYEIDGKIIKLIQYPKQLIGS